jgi:hypothetical protein
MIDKLPDELLTHDEFREKLNEIIDALNSMCDKRDYTPKPEGQMIGGVPMYGHGSSIHPCTHKHPDGRDAWKGYVTKAICEICGVNK